MVGGFKVLIATMCSSKIGIVFAIIFTLPT